MEEHVPYVGIDLLVVVLFVSFGAMIMISHMMWCTTNLVYSGNNDKSTYRIRLTDSDYPDDITLRTGEVALMAFMKSNNYSSYCNKLYFESQVSGHGSMTLTPSKTTSWKIHKINDRYLPFIYNDKILGSNDNKLWHITLEPQPGSPVDKDYMWCVR